MKRRIVMGETTRMKSQIKPTIENKDRPNRAAIYVRISRDRVGAGLGVERQEDDCRVLAKQMGLEVVRVLVDNDISAYSGKKRPGYM
ncbi:recombinase family protein, partial [Glaciimonas sp. Cout2]|uniref:recombinase family protein n=1 Tax=Glaciimonas sp. Cout2 TaxID=3048621 RepID=UPI002B22B138